MSGGGDQEPRPPWIYPVLLAGIISFAVSAILIRYADDAPSMGVAVWRTLFAVGLLAPTGIRRTFRTHFSLRDLGLIVLAGILLGVHFVSWIESVYLTRVSSAAVLVSTAPLFMALLGFLLLGERMSARVAVAIVVAFGGSVLLGFSDAGAGVDGVAVEGPNPLLGNGLALFAALVWALYLLIGRVVRQRMDWMPYVFPLYVVAAMTTFTFAWIRDVPLLGYDWSIYGLCLMMAVFPQLVGHGSFNYAVKFFPAAMLGLMALLEPVGAALLAYLLFAEVPGVWGLVGIALVLGGVAGTVLRGPASQAE